MLLLQVVDTLFLVYMIMIFVRILGSWQPWACGSPRSWQKNGWRGHRPCSESHGIQSTAGNLRRMSENAWGVRRSGAHSGRRCTLHLPCNVSIVPNQCIVGGGPWKIRWHNTSLYSRLWDTRAIYSRPPIPCPARNPQATQHPPPWWKHPGYGRHHRFVQLFPW